MTLREAIQEQHTAAEAHPFTAMLVSGQLPKETYANYLFNHLAIFSTLENRMRNTGLFADVPDLWRASRIAADLKELGVHALRLTKSTNECVDRLGEINDRQVMAYAYLYHLADMYGGQVIKRHIPGSGTRFEFNDRATLIAKIREQLDDDLADEAKHAFSYALRLFDELTDSPA